MRGACACWCRRGDFLHPLPPLWARWVPGVVAPRAVGALWWNLYAPLVFLNTLLGGVTASTHSAVVPPLADLLVVSELLADEAAHWFRGPGSDLECAEQPYSHAVRHLSPAGYFDLGR